jgi:hypothetical protein
MPAFAAANVAWMTHLKAHVLPAKKFVQNEPVVGLINVDFQSSDLTNNHAWHLNVLLNGSAESLLIVLSLVVRDVIGRQSKMLTVCV